MWVCMGFISFCMLRLEERLFDLGCKGFLYGYQDERG